jgi:hypothetical protein
MSEDPETAPILDGSPPQREKGRAVPAPEPPQPSEPPPPPAEPAVAPAVALLASVQQRRAMLWRHISATDQWQELQRLDGAIEALQLVIEAETQKAPGSP